ncbi:siderophore-interacting protein [Actinomycetospora lemnae]|uniref:Siderophore-interacting protein n=1 Tax=Actinomycetospora lemnae TaxID=3019891 RepID=A0ABT5T2R2_9PSEU|nr:siderophore-interacting protein [Actinomycetospora sp. DW7H6]MDD7969415.1 siderophore-interacting protein [Actinomycetospora sp. DW7H6]
MTSVETRPTGQSWIDGAPNPVRRVLHELTPRLAEVVRVRRLTPRMARVTLAADFTGMPSGAATDHVKLFFPAPGEELPVMPTVGERGLVPPPAGTPRNYRDYTVRRLDREAGELDVDMVVHAGGLAGAWAAAACAGCKVGVLGPRGSEIVADDLDWYVLAGDETALPAIGRWLAELPAGVRAEVFCEVADAAEEQELTSDADVTVHWLHRDGVPAGEAMLLHDALAAVTFPDGRGFVWVAGEAGALRPVRRMLKARDDLDQRDHDVDGYWRRGVVNHDHHAPAQD